MVYTLPLHFRYFRGWGGVPGSRKNTRFSDQGKKSDLNLAQRKILRCASLFRLGRKRAGTLHKSSRPGSVSRDRVRFRSPFKGGRNWAPANRTRRFEPVSKWQRKRAQLWTKAANTRRTLASIGNPHVARTKHVRARRGQGAHNLGKPRVFSANTKRSARSPTHLA